MPTYKYKYQDESEFQPTDDVPDEIGRHRKFPGRVLVMAVIDDVKNPPKIQDTDQHKPCRWGYPSRGPRSGRSLAGARKLGRCTGGKSTFNEFV